MCWPDLVIHLLTDNFYSFLRAFVGQLGRRYYQWCFPQAPTYEILHFIALSISKRRFTSLLGVVDFEKTAKLLIVEVN